MIQYRLGSWNQFNAMGKLTNVRFIILLYLYCVPCEFSMAQYSEGASIDSGNYATLPDYYSSRPLVGTGVTIVEYPRVPRQHWPGYRSGNCGRCGRCPTKCECAMRRLAFERRFHRRVPITDHVYRSGYDSLTGYYPPTKKIPGSGDYFSLYSAYKSR